jgi:hypothetical protein
VVSCLEVVPFLEVEPFQEVPSYLEVAFSFLEEASCQEEVDATYLEASLVQALEVSLAFQGLQHLCQDQLTQVVLITS